MAANKSQLNALVLRHIIPDVVDAVYDGHPLFWELERKGKMIEQDQTFSYPLLKTDPSGGFGFYDGFADVNPSASPDVATDTEWVLAHMKHDFLVPFTSFLEHRGPASAKDLVMLHRDAMMLSFIEALSVRLWSDNDASVSSLLGIPRITGTTTNACGGLTSTQVAGWAAKRVAASGSSNALEKIDISKAVVGATYGMDRPDIALANRELYPRIMAKYQGQERFMDPAVLRAGWEAINIMGINFYVDPKATGTAATNDNVLNILNSRYIRWAVHPDDHFVARPIGDNYPALRVIGAQSFLSAQLVCVDRRKQAAVHTINPDSAGA